MKSPLWMITVSCLIVVLILGVLFYFNIDEQVARLLRWIEASEPWSALLFIALMTAAVVLLLPGVLFTTGAGFIFGIVKGTLLVVIGTTLGATLSFLLARYCLGRRGRNFVLRDSRLQSLSREIARDDFRTVLLTRLIPFFPGKLANYFFGLLPVRPRNFILASALGFIPFSFHNAYLGSLAADLTTLGAQHAGRSPLQWLFLGLGLLLTMFALYYLHRTASRALAAAGRDAPANEETQ